MDADWFKGNCQFFLTQFGNPYSRVELDEFSKFIGERVNHKDLRKIFTTDIKYHSSQVLYFLVLILNR